MHWRLSHRVTAITATAAVLLLTTGFPLPPARVAADEDFPCKGHHCGCTSAEMCRNHCCCCAHEMAATSGRSTDDSHSDDHTASTGLMIEAMKCAGQSSTFVAGGVLLYPPADRVTVGRPEIYKTHRPIRSDRGDALADLEPPAPPPRAVA